MQQCRLVAILFFSFDAMTWSIYTFMDGQCTSAFDSKFDRSGREGMLFDDVVIGRIETSTRQCKKNRNSSNLIVANKWWKESIGCGLCSNGTWIAQRYSLPAWLLEIGMNCRIMKGNSIFYHLNPRMYCWTNATLLYLFCCVWASLQMVIMEVNWSIQNPEQSSDDEPSQLQLCERETDKERFTYKHAGCRLIAVVMYSTDM